MFLSVQVLGGEVVTLTIDPSVAIVTILKNDENITGESLVIIYLTMYNSTFMTECPQLMECPHFRSGFVL